MVITRLIIGHLQPWLHWFHNTIWYCRVWLLLVPVMAFRIIVTKAEGNKLQTIAILSMAYVVKE